MAETTDQLMNDARCIDKCIPDGMKLAVLISIFQQLLTNGTGGGGGGGVPALPNGQIFVGNAANAAAAVAMSGDATIVASGAVTLANTATARSDLGLGTTDQPQFLGLGLGRAAAASVSLITAGAIVSGAYFQGNDTAVPALNIDWSLGDYFEKTIAANSVFTFSQTGSARTIQVAITGDASHTVTWPAVQWAGGVPPVQTLSKVDVYTFTKFSGGTVYGSVVQNMS
jgi:hypothetical protein